MVTSPRERTPAGVRPHQGRDPDQPANLWQPVDGPGGPDEGAHGDFDERATSRSAQLWASQHHGLLAAVGGGLIAAGAAWVAGLGRR
jgi:hypothetical protein